MTWELLGGKMTWIPPDDLDPACLSLCTALNKLPGIRTSESCCGHGETSFHVWFKMDTTQMGAVILSRCLSGRYYCYAKGELRADPVWRVYVGDTEGPVGFLLEGKPMGGFGGKLQRATLKLYSNSALWDRRRRLVPEQHYFKKHLRRLSDGLYEPAEKLAKNLQVFVEEDFAQGKRLFASAKKEAQRWAINQDLR